MNLRGKIHCDTCKSRGKSVFCTLSVEQTRSLDRFKVVNAYRKGQILFYAGNPATGVYCVSSGRIKMYKAGSGGRQQIMGIAAQGDVLGYRSLFSDKPNSVTAEVLEDSTACFIDKNAFLILIAQNPSVAMNVVRTLSREMQAMEDRLLDLVDKPAHVRLARVLLMLKQAYGKAEPNGARLDISLSRQEMAELIGTTPETAIRLLSRFKKRGLVELNGRAVTLPNLDALLKMARLPL